MRLNVLALFSLVVLCGCGSKPVPPASPTPPEAKALEAGLDTTSTASTATEDGTEATKRAASTPDQGKAEIDNTDGKAAFAGVDDIASASSGSTSATLKSAASSVAESPTANSPTTESPKNTPLPKYQPTQEQLARWQQTPVSPLQLLACRDAANLMTELVVTADGVHYVTGGSQVCLWSTAAEQPLHVFHKLADGEFVQSLALAPNGKWLAAGDSTGMLRMWNMTTRQELQAKQCYSNDIVQVAIAPNSDALATISFDNEVTVWNAADMKERKRFEVTTSELKRIAFLDQESLVAAGETTSVWNVTTGKEEKQLSPGRYRYTLASELTGKRLVYGDAEELQIIHTDGGSGPRIAGGFAMEELFAFSPDGQLAATGNGSSLRIWEIATSRLVQIFDATGWEMSGLGWLPKSNLLVVASGNGRMRLWGSEATAQALGLKAMHSPIVLLAADSREPATPVQALAIIDLRVFPVPPASTVQSRDVSNLMLSTTLPATEVAQFYQYQFGQQGWIEVQPSVPTPNAMEFRKSGFMLSLSTYSDGTATTVNINHGGNIDLRWLPKLDGDVQVTFENENVVMYAVPGTMTEIESRVLRLMHTAGWTAYSRLQSSHNDQPDRRDLAFLRGGVGLRVSIAKQPEDPKRCLISYGRSIEFNSLPIPQDAGFVEFDGSTKPMLVATTKQDLQGTQAFYEQELASQGWLPRELGRSANDKVAVLEFIRNQQDLTVVLEKTAAGGTLIIVGDDSRSSSWQLAKSKTPNETDPPPAGIEAADFPILNATKIGKLDKQAQSIEVSHGSGSTLVEAADKYANHLISLGWKLDGSGIRESDYTFLTLVKDKAEIAIRARMNAGEAIVNIQGDGLLWNKELPGGRTVTSYETWLRERHLPASLEHLDAFAADMAQIESGQ